MKPAVKAPRLREAYVKPAVKFFTRDFRPFSHVFASTNKVPAPACTRVAPGGVEEIRIRHRPVLINFEPPRAACREAFTAGCLWRSRGGNGEWWRVEAWKHHILHTLNLRAAWNAFSLPAACAPHRASRAPSQWCYHADAQTLADSLAKQAQGK